MSRQERRRIERELNKVRKGDNCTMCGKAFPHNSRTYGGATADGTAVFVGECCARHLITVVGSGIYVTQPIDLLTTTSMPGSPRAKKVHVTPDNLDQALTSMQSLFSDIDAHANTLMRQAGIQKQSRGVFLGDHAWKAEDAAWFKANPDRSHRLRPVHESEAEMVLTSIPQDQIPPTHRVEILVRQVEPGKRIRASFARNTEIDIPDQEEIIHAIFDAVASAGEGKVIDLGETVERARQYASSRGQQLN